MACWNRKKAVMVSLIGLIFLVFLCAGSVYAAQAGPVQKLPFDAPPSDLKMQNVPITKEPKVRIAPKFQVKIPINITDRKADLKCTIKGFHNQARTRPIVGNIWHLNPGFYSPPLALPWYIYYDIEVTNAGTAKAENFVIKINFINPTKPPQNFYETETLNPGETVVLKYYWGYFYPGMYYQLVNRQVIISSQLDTTAKITESNEGNNVCGYPVRFMQ